MNELNNELACLSTRMGYLGQEDSPATPTAYGPPAPGVTNLPGWAPPMEFQAFGAADTSVSAAPATAGAYTPWTQVPPTFEEGSGNKYSPATILRSPAALSAKPVAYGPPAPGKTLPGWPSSGATPFNQILTSTSAVFDPLVKAQMAINLQQQNAKNMIKPPQVPYGLTVPSYGWVLGGLAVLAVLGVVYSMKK